MCRLLGSVSRVPVTIDQVLGDERGAFLELAAVHGDGWGHAWLDGTALEVRKSPDSARKSAELAALAASTPSEAWVTHLRWATMGLPVQPDNTHPFSDGTVAFAHNGSIDPPAALDDLIAPELAAHRKGDTDSERFFLALLSRMSHSDPAQALVDTVGAIMSSAAKAKSMNCMLLTPEALYAVCSYDPLSDEDPDYYPLLYRTVGERVVVASTGWTDSAGWQTLSNGQLLVIDRTTLQTRIIPVGSPVDVVPTAS